MAVQLMSHYFLHYKNLKKTKDGNWGMTTRTMKSMKLCIYHYLYLYAFIMKVFTIVMKTAVAYIRFLGVNYVIS